MRQKRPLCLLVTAVLTVAASAAREPGAPLKPGFNMFSKQQDVQLGQEAAAQVRKQVAVVQNQFLQDYLQRIGQRLASQPEAGGFPYSFSLVQDKSINAFALPGGPTFVNSGTIAAADNEAQLAGVMAHEIAHVALRHGTNQASKANLLQIPAALAGAIAGGNGSMMGQLAQLGIGLGFNSVLLKYSRDAETQADALGSHLMAEAGYNPIEMARFFEKLQAAGGSRAPTFLSDHPNPGNRQQAIEAEIRTLPQRSYGFQAGEFQRVKSEVSQLPAANSRALRGSATNPSDVRPSGQLQQYQGSNFALSYPSNWQVFGDNNSDSITIAPREGLVQDAGGNVQIGYGVIASYFFPERQGANLRQQTEDLVNHLHATNPGMQISRNPRNARINGNAGMITMLSSTSPLNGQAESDAVLTVARPEGLFYMVFIAPTSEFQNLESIYNQVIRSVQFR
jgi:predicted Zn-dependent protease